MQLVIYETIIDKYTAVNMIWVENVVFWSDS